MIKYSYRKPWARLAMTVYDTVGSLFFRKRAVAFTQPKRITILALHQIGDVVMSTPTCAAIRAMAPDADLTIVVGSGPTQILRDNPWQAKIESFDATWQWTVRHLNPSTAIEQPIARRKLATLLQSLQPDVVIAFQPDLIVNQIIGKLAPPVSIGFDNAGGGFFLTHPIHQPPAEHYVESTYRLAAVFAQIFNYRIPSIQPPKLIVEKSAQASLTKKFPLSASASQKLIVLHPFPSVPTKAWDTGRWRKLMEWLREEGWLAIIIGGRADVFDQLPNGIQSLTGQLNLAETLALIAEADLFIGVDSGPGHIAAAVGTPVISISSSVNNPARSRPYSDRVTLLCVPPHDRQSYPEELRQLPPHTIGNPYTDGITVDMVIDAVQGYQKKIIAIRGITCYTLGVFTGKTIGTEV